MLLPVVAGAILFFTYLVLAVGRARHQRRRPARRGHRRRHVDDCHRRHLARRGLRHIDFRTLVTGANIGSVATITGNPQNMLIASLSHIRYAPFLSALG